MNILAANISQLTVVVFLCIIFLCFLKYVIINQQIESKGVQKILGGFASFIFVLLSNNPFVQAVGIIIGGLIIASEEFMQNLMIILRSKSEDIKGNLSVSNPTKKEIRDKKDKEVKQIIQFEKKSIKKYAVRYDTITVDNLISIERAVSRYFKDKYKESYREDQKHESDNGTIIVDGEIVDANSHPNNIVEIEHVKYPSTAVQSIAQIVERVREVISIDSIVITICFVIDNPYTVRDLIKLYNEIEKFNNVKLGIFSVKNSIAKPIIEPVFH